MTNPCPSKKCDSKWVPHPPTRFSSAGVDDSGLRICGIGGAGGDFSQTNRENDLSSSTEFLERSLSDLCSAKALS